MKFIAPCCLAGLLVTFFSTTASADDGIARLHIGLDMDFNHSLDIARSGGGFNVRVGEELDLIAVSLTPEIGFGYHAFSGANDPHIYTGFAGGRLSFGKIIEPSVYAHAGIGRLVAGESRTSPLIDGGLALDFTLLPLIDIGVHGGYNVVLPKADDDAFKYFTVGLQAALVF